jgi:acyl-homoserine lactone acylase PvdQ
MYLIAGYMAFSFTETLKIDPVMEHLKALGPEYYKYVCPECATFEKSANGNDSSSRAALSALLDQTQQSLPFQIWTGSNAFVVSGARSQNGSVLFANDTHIGYQQPAVWFEAHLQYPGMNLYGKYIAGMPFPLVAHNGFSSYGVTILENDDIQLYREEQVGQAREGRDRAEDRREGRRRLAEARSSGPEGRRRRDEEAEAREVTPSSLVLLRLQRRAQRSLVLRQPKVSCAGVQPLEAAIASILATRARFCSKFCS